MKMLKIGVVVMGIAIVIGLGVLTMQWAEKYSEDAGETAAKPAEPAAVEPGVPVPAAPSPENMADDMAPSGAAAPEEPAPPADSPEASAAPAGAPETPMTADQRAVAEWEAAQAADKGAAPAPATLMSGHLEVDIPEGAKVVSVSSGDLFVDVLVKNPDGSHELYQVERSSGRVAIVRLVAAGSGGE